MVAYVSGYANCRDSGEEWKAVASEITGSGAVTRRSRNGVSTPKRREGEDGIIRRRMIANRNAGVALVMTTGKRSADE